MKYRYSWELFEVLKRFDEVREEMSSVVEELEQYMGPIEFLELKGKIEDLEERVIMLKRISNHYL